MARTSSVTVDCNDNKASLEVVELVDCTLEPLVGACDGIDEIEFVAGDNVVGVEVILGGKVDGFEVVSGGR